MRDEIISGLCIEKKLDPPARGHWPFLVYEIRDTRGSVDAPLVRVVYVFPDIDSQHWKPKLLERLRVLSEKPHDHVVRIVEFGRTPTGGLYVIEDTYAPFQSSGPLTADQLWVSLGQAAEGLAALHKSCGPHGYLVADNLVTSADRKLLIQGASYGPLHCWSNGLFVGDGRQETVPPCRNNDSPTTEADVFALGAVFRTLVAANCKSFGERRKDALLELLANPESDAFPVNGERLVRKIRWAGNPTVIGRLIRTVREAASLEIESFGQPMPSWRRRLLAASPYLCAALAVISAILVMLVVGTWRSNTALARGLTDTEAKFATSQKTIESFEKHCLSKDARIAELEEKIKIGTKGPPNVPDKPPETKDPLTGPEIRHIALREWEKQANANTTFNDLKANFSNPALPKQVREKLAEWVSNIEKGGEFTIFPKDGRIGTDIIDSPHTFDVKINDARGGDFTLSVNSPGTFTWKPGDSITVEIWTKRGSLNPLRVANSHALYKTKTYSGPVAIWQLSQDGHVGDDQGWADFKLLQPVDPQ